MKRFGLYCAGYALGAFETLDETVENAEKEIEKLKKVHPYIDLEELEENEMPEIIEISEETHDPLRTYDLAGNVTNDFTEI